MNSELKAGWRSHEAHPVWAELAVSYEELSFLQCHLLPDFALTVIECGYSESRLMWAQGTQMQPETCPLLVLPHSSNCSLE